VTSLISDLREKEAKRGEPLQEELQEEEDIDYSESIHNARSPVFPPRQEMTDNTDKYPPIFPKRSSDQVEFPPSASARLDA